MTIHETNFQPYTIKDHFDFCPIDHLLPALADVCHGDALGHLPVWISASILSRLGTVQAGTELLRVQRAVAGIGHSLLVRGQRGDYWMGAKESKIIHPAG